MARAVALLPLVLCLTSPARADFVSFLLNDVGFSEKQVAALEREPVVEKLDVSNDKRELAVLGVVRIAAPAAEFVARFRDVESFPANEEVKGRGAIREPAAPEDLQGLELPEKDLDSLEECRVGSCKMKLPRSAIESLGEIDWKRADARPQVLAGFAQGAVDYVNEYREEGNDALVVYVDQKETQGLADGFAYLLERRDHLPVYLPELHRYLLEYPAAKPDGAEDLFSWSLEDFGLQVVTMLNHAVLYPTEVDDLVCAIGVKQIYASHYFHARLQLIAVFDGATDPSSPAMYVAYLDHSLFDGDLSWANRKLLSSRVTGSTRSRLEFLRDAFQKGG